MSTVLVTGGAGFIGSHLAELLMHQGNDVVVLDDFSGGYISNLDFEKCGKFSVVHGSICDSKLIESIFHVFKFDYVYHLGAYAAEGLSPFLRRFNYENNVIGSVNLINAAVNHDVRCFVFTSSMAVYGHGRPPFQESDDCSPCDPYGMAKFVVERELAMAREMFGLDYVIFRPHNVLGERQNLGDRYRNVAAIFMWQCLNGHPMTIYGDGEQIRAFSDVQDMVPIIAAAPGIREAIGKSFNIGGDIPCSINELSTLVAESLDTERNVTHLETRREVRNAFCSHYRVRSVFGNLPQTPLPETLKRMADWARQNVARFDHRKICDPEITKNLPSYWR